MVAGHTGTDPFPAPAVFWLVDPAKSGFILEHKADFPGVVDKLKFLYCGVNFFEAAISSSLAFLGCFGALPFAIHADAEQSRFDHC